MNNVATVASRKFENGERRDYGGPDELARCSRAPRRRSRQCSATSARTRTGCCTTASRARAGARGNVALLGDRRAPDPAVPRAGRMHGDRGCGGALGLLEKAGDVGAALAAYERERYLRTARVTITSRIFGDISTRTADARDLRNTTRAENARNLLGDSTGCNRGIESLKGRPVDQACGYWSSGCRFSCARPSRRRRRRTR